MVPSTSPLESVDVFIAFSGLNGFTELFAEAAITVALSDTTKMPGVILAKERTFQSAGTTEITTILGVFETLGDENIVIRGGDRIETPVH